MLGESESFNQSLEKAGRVADFFELAELMCQDALRPRGVLRRHFREEYQTDEGEAQRDDENFAYVAAWAWQGTAARPSLAEGTPSCFEYAHLTQGATTKAPRLVPGRARREGDEDLPGRRRQPRHVVPRDARRRQRGA